MQYNQTEKGQAVRVGNWFEELKLKEDTGIRFYPAPTQRETSLLTKTRCIVHTAQTDPKDYVSVTHSTLRNPRNDPGFLVVEKTGPRLRRFEQSAKAEIDQKLKTQALTAAQESRRLTYETEATSKLSKADFKASLIENDFTIRVPTKTSSYSTDTAITFYSHSVEKGNGNVGFPMTFVTSMNPFRKNCVFSADIVIDALSTRTETYERPRGLPTVREFKSLVAFRSRMIDHVRRLLADRYGRAPYPGHAVNLIVNVLAKFEDRIEVPLQEIEALLFDELGAFQFSPAERYAVIAAFDKRIDDAIAVYDVAVLFRRTPAPRRQELIALAYELMDPIGEGKVAVDAIEEKFGGNPPSHAQAFLDYVSSPKREFSFEDFRDFYAYVSSEVESDAAFEQLIKDAWGSL